MGFLHSELNRSYLRERGTSGASANEDWPDDVTTVSFRHSLVLELSADELARTRERLDAFKRLRNRVVHNLLDDFDVATQGGCESAIAFLDDSFEQAKAAYAEVRQWADTILTAREHLVAFVQSPEFESAIFHGIFPDGTIDWSGCTPVRLLRRFEKETTSGEMTCLDDALKVMQSTHPDHNPARYFCKNWLDLLKRSGQFEIRRVKGDAQQRGSIWYRSRRSSTA